MFYQHLNHFAKSIHLVLVGQASTALKIHKITLNRHIIVVIRACKAGTDYGANPNFHFQGMMMTLLP